MAKFLHQFIVIIIYMYIMILLLIVFVPVSKVVFRISDKILHLYTSIIPNPKNPRN